MIAPLRRVHAAAWPVLAALLALLLSAALVNRPAWDTPSPWPATLGDGAVDEVAR